MTVRIDGRDYESLASAANTAERARESTVLDQIMRDARAVSDDTARDLEPVFEDCPVPRGSGAAPSPRAKLASVPESILIHDGSRVAMARRIMESARSMLDVADALLESDDHTASRRVEMTDEMDSASKQASIAASMLRRWSERTGSGGGR